MTGTKKRTHFVAFRKPRKDEWGKDLAVLRLTKDEIKQAPKGVSFWVEMSITNPTRFAHFVKLRGVDVVDYKFIGEMF